MSSAPAKKIFDSEDDDDELPNLSERFQSVTLSENVWQKKKSSDNESDEDEFLKSAGKSVKTPLTKFNVNRKKISESDSDENEFLKFSERIKNTPRSQAMICHNETTKKMTPKPEFFNSVERNKNTVLTKFNLHQKRTSSSENDENDFLNFSEKIKNTPRSKAAIYKKEIIQKISSKPASSNSGYEMKKTAVTKFNFCQKGTSDSESDENDFLHFSERIRNTHRSRVKHLSANKTCSTPLSEINVSLDSEEDSVFLKLSERKIKQCTPKSQNRICIGKEDIFLSPEFPEKKKLFSVLNVINESNNTEISAKDSAAPVFFTPVQAGNVDEYNSLFSSALEMPNSFMIQRTRYAEQLFDFFNKKIFDSKLPEDMQVIWSNTLQRTAGLTHCSRKNDVYSCYIELCSKLLTSFDRLRDTLLHEMCHAAVWMISKSVDVKHGPLWQIWASRCKLILPNIECPTRCHNYEGNYRLWYYCSKCNWKKGRCRQSKQLATKVCKKCRTPIQIRTSF